MTYTLTFIRECLLGFQIFKITNVWIGLRDAKTFTIVMRKSCRNMPDKRLILSGNDAYFKGERTYFYSVPSESVLLVG